MMSLSLNSASKKLSISIAIAIKSLTPQSAQLFFSRINKIKVSNALKDTHFTNLIVTVMPGFSLNSAPDERTDVASGECYPP
jgi:hypothetical protein